MAACENYLHLGKGYMRTAPDLGTAAYTAPSGLTLVSFYFYTIASNYYVALFLSDGSAVQQQVDPDTHAPIGSPVTIGGPGTFYQSSTGSCPLVRSGASSTS